MLEEGEVPHSEVLISDTEENSGKVEIVVPCVAQEIPIKPSISPSYVEILKKNMVDSFGSSDEDSFEQSSKKAGRKSHKEIREEEAERLKMQGSQATIEMSMGRTKRNGS